MKKSFFPYPTISAESIGANVSVAWSNEAGDSFQTSEAPDLCGAIELKEFLPDEMPLSLFITVNIATPRAMFNHPGLRNDDKVGIALKYSFKGLGEQSVLPFDSPPITNETAGAVTGRLSYTWPPKTLRGVSTFIVILYLKELGQAEGGFVANVGAELGVLWECKVITGGDGAIFPIFEESIGSDQPLWRISSQIDATTLESDFDAVFKVYVNADNPAYNLLGMTRAVFTPMLFEIFTSVCVMLLSYLQKLGDDIQWNLQEESDDGSVIAKIRCFAQRFLPGITEDEIRSWSCDRLANVVRENVYREVKDKIEIGVK